MEGLCCEILALDEARAVCVHQDATISFKFKGSAFELKILPCDFGVTAAGSEVC